MPDDVYSPVNDYARRHDLNRSESFVLAARQLLEQEERDRITDAVNAAPDAARRAVDTDGPFLRKAAESTLAESDW